MNCERHCLWKRYTPSLWILAKPLEEKVEFSLTKRQWLYLLKKGKKKKKSWEASRRRALMRKRRSAVRRIPGKLFQTSPSLGRDVPAGSAVAPGRTGCGMGTVGEGELGLTPGFSKMHVLGISRGWHSNGEKQTNRSVRRHVGGMMFLLEELLFFHRAKKAPCKRARAPCEQEEAKWENCICWIVLCLLSGENKS